jgi:hypothetical protein
LRVVLAPEKTLFEQVAAFLLRQPAPPTGWHPSPGEEGAALARLVWRWGSYFAAIGDPDKPEWTEGIPLGISRFNDREQARMSIEISANMEAVHHLSKQQPGTWRHLVHATRCLPGPKPTDETATSTVLHGRGWDGEYGVTHDTPPMPRVLPATGMFPASPQTLEAFRLNPVRRILNVAALATWRVPMEGYHGDHRSVKPRPALPLDRCRFTATELGEVEAIMARAGNGLLHTLHELQRRDGEELERLAAATMGGEAGRKWSVTERTRNVVLW